MPPKKDTPASAAAGTPPADVPLIENVFAPEIFADLGIRCTASGAMAKITLTSARYDHSATPPRLCEVVVGRLTMPADGAERFAIALFDFLKQHKANMMPGGEPRMQ